MTRTWAWIALALLPAVMAPGCAGHGVRRGPVPEIQWPPAPAEARIRYGGDLASLAKKRSSGFFAGIGRLLSGAPSEIELVRPAGLHADAAGKLFIVDQGARSLYVLDAEEHLILEVDLADIAGLEEPVDVVTDASGRIYITDPRRSEVAVLDRKGRFLKVISDPALKRPTGLAHLSSEDHVIVVDTLGGEPAAGLPPGERVPGQHLFRYQTEDGVLVGLPAALSGSIELNHPVFATEDGTGNLWVTDSLNFRLCRFTPGGKLVGVFGISGDGPGTFARPKGVAVDRDGNVYVVDALFGNCQIFSPDGELLLHFGGAGRGPGEFMMPNDIAITGDRIYISDAYNRRIQGFHYLGPPPVEDAPEGGNR
ncbi:MAG: 6-bladed beta-propeller [Planctomycetota bacterium]